MAKPQAEIIAFPTNHGAVLPFPIVQCGCKRSDCGRIDTLRDTHIYSRATKETYSDMVCLTDAVGAHYSPIDRIVIFDGYRYTNDEFLKELQAYWMNDLVPIA